MKRHTKWDGDAHVSAQGDRHVRVWIEAPNVTAEVYIARAKAVALRDRLNWILDPKPAPRPSAEKASA